MIKSFIMLVRRTDPIVLIYLALIMICVGIGVGAVYAQSNTPSHNLLMALWNTCFNDDWITVKFDNALVRMTCQAEVLQQAMK